MAPSDTIVEPKRQPRAAKTPGSKPLDPWVKWSGLLGITLFFSYVFRLLLELEIADQLVQKTSFYNFSFDILILSFGVWLGSNSKGPTPVVAIMIGLVVTTFVVVVLPRISGVEDIAVLIASLLISVIVYGLTVREA